MGHMIRKIKNRYFLARLGYQHDVPCRLTLFPWEYLMVIRVSCFLIRWVSID